MDAADRSGERPDPDRLLQQMQRDEALARRGKLKIFFGASAGVGKTYAMLAAARAAQAQGTALIVGLVETHGRAETEAMLRGLPRLPLKSVPHRDRTLQEFDLDAALAWAHGQADPLLLLDELAHSNAPGSRHTKRWQDVEELLDSGIDVWSTMNVQHLESLNDIVSGITGIRVWETVPDRLFDEADEVVVVDLPPDELLARLKAGKVYLPQQAERAAANFFRKGNLLALRELALRRTADRVDDEMQAWRRRSSVQSVWPNREALLACVGAGDSSEKVVRACARLAAQLDVPWHAVHVDTPTVQRLPPARREQALRVLKLAQELGATVATPSAPEAAPALVRYAREHNLARLLVGRSNRRWRWQRSAADRVVELADELDVVQVSLPAALRDRPAPSAASPQMQTLAGDFAWRGHAAAVVACALTTLLATPLIGLLELTNIVMFFLLAVVGVGWVYGRGPAVLAAFLGVALFNFFFVPPRFSFAVHDGEFLVTFAVMLVVALAIGQLTAGLKVQAQAATQREHRMRSLYDMSRDLSAALLPEQVAEIGARFLAAEFGARSTLLATDEHDRLAALRGGNAAVDEAVAQWAFDRGEAAGFGTDTLAASACLVLPLKAPMRLRGVLAVQPADRRTLGPDQRRLLDTCASLLAISLERIHYIDVASKSTVQIETERLRNSLLSAISHDLRTPLAAMVGLADTLAMTSPPLPAAQGELTAAIRESALRMNAMVGNLLDMARLEAGAAPVRREWQPLEEVVGSALAACAPALQGRPVRVKLADDLPLLHLDAVLFERVLVNLLENAAKYTPAGSAVELSASASSSTVTIVVDDHGPGLPPGREEALFDKFERGSKESAAPGVGLGLAISRAIVQTHGGAMRGENRRGPAGIEGARFVIELPRGEPPVDDGSMSASENSSASASASAGAADRV
jgi:two-component system, OmpR family, sensor histidine kinase KdpD